MPTANQPRVLIDAGRFTDSSNLFSQLIANGLTCCIIHRGGKTVFHYEQYEGASRQLLPVNSCTKSVLSALICIAMDKGLLPGPDTPAGEFYPRLLRDPDERKGRITLRHLLTMTPGFRWQEFGGINSFPKMYRTRDWIGYVLEQPLAYDPGSTMIYSSGDSQLLAGILAQATGESIARFAEQHLFGPLGVRQYEWPRDPQGIHTGGFGLKLTALDLLRFGLLYLQQGMWEGREVVPRRLLLESVKPAAAALPPERGWYGWHWWADSVKVKLKVNARANDPTKKPPSPQGSGSKHHACYYARGFGGQFVFVAPELDAVVVFLRQPQRKDLAPLAMFRETILPLLAVSSR